jgi:uncharacterized membrane protein YozB (DUF420 family)
MDAKVIYWAAAVINFAALTATAIAGVRHAKRGEFARHRRSMLIATGLVAAFLVSYVLKLALLGRETIETWSPRDVWTLRLHETCVLAMLVGGGIALARSRALRRSRRFTRDPGDPQPEPGDLRQHRLAGRIAVTGAVLGLLSAGWVWMGMWSRSG